MVLSMDNLPDQFIALSVKNPGSLAQFQQFKTSDVLNSDVIVKVKYTTLNYKDVLVIHGAQNVIKNYPMIPGSDFVGEVLKSNVANFSPGDKVMGSGFGLGEFKWGGLSLLVGANQEWLLKIPDFIDEKQLISLGNAGLTAFACVDVITRNLKVRSQQLPIVVTGTTGGVGSIALNVLAKLGYQTVAVVRNINQSSYVKQLGAHQVVTPDDLNVSPEKKLWHQRFDGAIDAVGGELLSKILLQLSYKASVACCGHVAGDEIRLSLYPLILRAINIQGVEMVYFPVKQRLELLNRYFKYVDFNNILITEITFDETLSYAKKMRNNDFDGRVIIRVAD